MGSLSLDDSLFRNQELPSLSSALAYTWYSVGRTWCILVRGSWQPLPLSLSALNGNVNVCWWSSSETSWRKALRCLSARFGSGTEA